MLARTATTLRPTSTSCRLSSAGLLHRHGRSDLLMQVLVHLVRLTEPIRHDGDLLPGWWCRTGPRGQTVARWRGGHGNLGLAHAISGPLALLSTALRRGITVPNVRAASLRASRVPFGAFRPGTPTNGRSSTTPGHPGPSRAVAKLPNDC
jgi:hypothetical protein